MNVNQSKLTCIVLASLAMLLLPFQLLAETQVVKKPHTFSAGTPARASEVNSNFDVAYEHIQKLLNVVCKYHPTEPLCETEIFTNDFGMSFVLIPPGTFVMGSPEGETTGRYSDEEIQHSVTLTQSFYLQTTEVTQGQWKALMGNNPSHFSSCGDDCPVENVSWEDIQEFIGKLNLHENAHLYQLPTEAQWEYAARAGSTTALANGHLAETGCSIDNNLNAMAWYCGNADSKTHQVAQKKANAWGLYDMHGNVWEWCQDWKSAYPTNSVTDPRGPSTGTVRVRRGGGWTDGAQYCRSAQRGSTAAGSRSALGLRLSMTLNP